MENSPELVPVEPYYHLPSEESMSVVERVAFRIALQAHAGRYREKAEGRMPEIHHLAMTRNILAAAGIDNPMTLAAAWLHDTLEDCHEFTCHPAQNDTATRDDDDVEQEIALIRGKALLRKKYATQLIEAGIDHLDANSIAELVSKTVHTLSNHLVAPDSKVEQQADKISSYSDRARVIKISDQLSSMVDDICYQSTAKTPEELIRYFHKAAAVINECTGVHPLLDKLAEEITHARYQQIHHPEGLGGFNFSGFMQNFVEKQSTSEPYEHWINLPDIHDKTHGITSINVNNSGHVIGYRILTYGADLKKLAGDEALVAMATQRNAVSNHLHTLLNLDAPADALGSQVNIRFRTLDHGRFCRTYMLKIPVELSTFIDQCDEAGALDKTKILSLKKAVEKIRQDGTRRAGGWSMWE